MSVNDKIFDNLSGKVLVATPYMLEGIFNKSLVYMLSHTAEGAMGLIFNNLVNHIEIKSFFKISDDQVDSNIMMPIYLGGPVEHERGFFLHSDDYNENLLLKFQNHLAVSSNPKIPHDIASGHGPKNSLFIIGYTAWKAGQLETEIKENLWIITKCDKEFIFSDHPESKWHNALQNLGIKESHFTSQMANA
ncbi:YqgE/AlgH family protein [Candidatus Tisiphia endosymbiont of Ditula angustiorana]|uniref:YqgE/AlgH family protein n=1 Tax=Candidatus Tisiphia endosymbiont of Ditula angustiorana TaxID=3066272 RepID=UPI00312CA5A8